MGSASRPTGRSAQRVLAFFCFLVLGLAAHAAAGSLTGTILDPDGRPVPGARLRIAGPLGVRVTYSDAAGRYDVPELPPAAYRVLVDAPGLTGSAAVEGLQADEARTVDVTLSLGAVLESVVVSAAQVETPLGELPANVAVVTAADLRERQVDSVGDALRLLPGITVSRSGSRGALTSVFPRGGESDYTLVLVDGLRVNAFGGGFDFAQAALGSVERIEFVRGPQSALHGADAIGGVVQVVTNHGGPIRGEALLEGGSQETSRIVAGSAGSHGRWSWSGSAERGASEGFTGVAPANGETVSNDDWRQRQLSGALGWESAGGVSVRGTARAMDSDRGFPGPYGSNPIGSFPGVDTVSRGRSADRQGGLSAAFPWGTVLQGRVRQRVSATLSDLDTAFESPYGPSAFETRRLTARAQTDVVLAASSSVSAGVELQGERARSTYITGEAFQEVPVERSTVGYFGELRQALGARVALTAGLRLEHIRRDALEGDPNPYAPRPAFAEDSLWSANPRIALVYALRADASGAPQTRVHASAGTGIRPPDAYEIAFTDNPSLQPERSRSIEAGLTHAAGRSGLELQATVFRNDYDDLIVAVAGSFQDASRYRTDNISNARAQGLEAGASWRGPGGLVVRGGYTWLDTEILAVDRADAAPPPFAVGDPLPRRPRHQGSLDVTVARAWGSAFAEVGGRGRALDIEPNYGAFGGLFTVPGFATVNMGATVSVHRSIDVFARVTNLFDRSYEETLGFPALGRSGMAGVRVAVSR